MNIKSDGITRFKFHLSHTDLYSNIKKCLNVAPKVKKEMVQLLVEMNKVKAKVEALLEVVIRLENIVHLLKRTEIAQYAIFVV